MNTTCARGVVIDGRGRDIVLKVHKYFEDERDNCKLMLQRLMALETGSIEVKVPHKLFNDVLNYFKSTSQVAKRVIAATQINKNSLTKIKKEGEVAKANNTSLLTPVKKPRGKKKFFSDLKIKELRNILRTNYIEGKQDFNFKNLVNMVRNDMNYRGSLATLRRIIWDMGFRWKKQPGKMLVTLFEYLEKSKINLTDNDEDQKILCSSQRNEDNTRSKTILEESNQQLLYLEVDSNLEEVDNPVTAKVEHGLLSSSSGGLYMEEEYLEESEWFEQLTENG